MFGLIICFNGNLWRYSFKIVTFSVFWHANIVSSRVPRILWRQTPIFDRVWKFHKQDARAKVSFPGIICNSLKINSPYSHHISHHHSPECHQNQQCRYAINSQYMASIEHFDCSVYFDTLRHKQHSQYEFFYK